MLEIQALAAGYGGSRVLDGLDLALAEGSVTALLGRNGMGKTTLMRAVMGLIRPAAGRIRFAGRDITGLKPYRISNLGIAYVPQGREIFAAFTVEENLRLGVIGKGGDRVVPQHVWRLFPALAERRRQRGGTLSGGQQQQLAIARALVGRPRLLLLDEPSEGIQPSLVAEIGATLGRIAATDGLTILLVEQNVAMVLAIAGDCLFLENGRIAARHQAAELNRDQDILHRYLAI